MGFTVLEVLVALLVSALVVGLAYTTLSAATDAEARVADAQQRLQDDAGARVLLGDALRHAVAEARADGRGWHLEPDGRGGTARLTFVSRGIQPPYGATGRWSVSVLARGGQVHIEAVPLDAAGPRLATMVHAPGMAVSVRPPGRTEWRDAWSDSTRLPDAVAIAWRAADGREVAPPLVARTSGGVAP
jgi:type II secretory pathway pseudopilin PulG